MRKILSILAIIVFVWFGLVAFNSCDKGVETASTMLSTGSATYLVCGFDSASQNTDSILLVNYSFSDNSVSFVQIPRDTYYAYDGGTRINSIYPRLVSMGVGEEEAMERLVRIISRSLAIDIDGYIGISTDALATMIDNIGGITMDMPYDMNLQNANGDIILSLKAGENHISGKDALKFIRSRNTYAMGDISRIDAQKLFISALITKFRNELDITDVIKEFCNLKDNSVSDYDIAAILKMLVKNRGRIDNIKAQYANLSGETVCSENGVWYYSIRKMGANKLLDIMKFKRIGVIDPDGRFLNEASKEFAGIYNNTSEEVIIYDDSTLSKLEIK